MIRGGVGPFWNTLGTWERVWTILLLATCLVIFAGALLPHLDGDDKFFGDIARQILATGDWLTLQHPGRGPAWVVDKPPLSFWLMAISIRLGGDNAAALRFWQLLMAVVTIFVTFRIARLGAGKEEALLAAVLLGTSALFFYLSLNPKQDVPLSLFLALAFYTYLTYRAAGRTRDVVLAGVCVALAVLSKGIVALGAFAPVIIVDWLSSWSTTRGGHWRWTQIGAGAAAFVLVAAPWFIVGAVRQGRPFIDTFFLAGTLGVGRFFEASRRGLPYWEATFVMIVAVMAGAVPWAGFVPSGVSEAWRSLRAGPQSVRLCMLWAGLYFALVALSPGYKLFHHLLPMYVPIAVLTARAIMTTPSNPRPLWVPAAIALLAVVPVVAMIVLAQARYPEEARFYLPLVPTIVLLLVSLGAFAAFALRGRGRTAVAVACAVSLLAYGSAELTMMNFRGLQVELPRGHVEERAVHATTGFLQGELDYAYSPGGNRSDLPRVYSGSPCSLSLLKCKSRILGNAAWPLLSRGNCKRLARSFPQLASLELVRHRSATREESHAARWSSWHPEGDSNKDHENRVVFRA